MGRIFMRKTHLAWHILLLIFFILPLFYFSTTCLLAADNKAVLIKETTAGKEITIPSIGIKKALFEEGTSGILIIEVDKQGPMRWVMHGTRIVSITWLSQTIRLDNEWDISMLELIKDGQEIFIHFLPPEETAENKMQTRGVDIRFGMYVPPDYTDYSK